MSLFKLPRRARYGNTGAAFNEGKPKDDQYLFRAENTQDLWGGLRRVSEQFGLDFFADGNGDFVLRTRNNPHVGRKLLAQDFATSSTQLTKPNAYGGTVLQFTGAVATSTITVNAARIDLVLPRGPSYGAWTTTVKQGATTVAGPTVHDPSNTDELHFYDYRTTVDGTNATVVTLYTGYFDTYTIEITSSGGTGGTERYIDALLLWHTDPATPLLPIALSTEDHALGIETQSLMNNMRNHVIVVGRRNAAVTDSQKELINPANPSYEFVVASGTDIASVAQPFLSDGVTPNPTFLGYPKESIIYDEKIGDRDFAEYVARTFIYRLRKPLPGASIEHTLLPELQIHEPVYVVEQPYDTLDASTVQYVQSISHTVSMSDGIRATTSIQTSPFSEFPSYEKREDVDIDTHYNGSPVADVEVSYTSLSGHAKLNLGLDLVEDAGEVVTISGETVSGGQLDLTGQPWPPLPGSLFVKPISPTTSTATVDKSYNAVFSNTSVDGNTLTIPVPRIQGNPTTFTIQVLIAGFGTTNYFRTFNALDASTGITYVVDDVTDMIYVRGIPLPPNLPSAQQLFVSTANIHVVYNRHDHNFISDWMTNTPYQHIYNVSYDDTSRIVDLLWRQGDGGSLYARPTNTFDVKYRALGPVDGGNAFADPYAGNVPFFDPYTSELGERIKVSFSALVSGDYRVSIRSRYDDTVVAYLTEAGADATDPELHWQYLDAGSGKEFYWDGVDQVGDWNRRQSDEYGELAYGAFPVEEKPRIGAGFYVWNREEATENGYPAIGLISGERDATTKKPIFGAGTYAEWYVHFEVKNDTLEELHESVGTPYPREVSSDSMNWGSGDVSAMIYTHLPEPSKVELDIADWASMYQLFDETDATAIDTAANWSSTPHPDKLINNQHPVRFRFITQDRPGTLWTGNRDQISLRLNRVVHLRYNLQDQLALLDGTVYPGTVVPSRRIVNRRMTVDDHTLQFQDDAWRLASTFKESDGDTGLEWIFVPKYFRKNFRGIENESLQFGDYLQLEEVPNWNAGRAIGGASGRLLIAFINYLFYLSAYTQDRSGRYTWCINPDFIDKSKILQNQLTDWTDGKPTQWPDDMNRQFRRSVITRQWTQERVDGGQLWHDAQAAEWNLTPGTVGYSLLAHPWRDHDPTIGSIRGPDGSSRSWTSFGLNIDEPSEHLYQNDKLSSAWHNMARQLGNSASTKLGLWTWETNPTWVPCVPRDFHGYFLLPPMPDVTYRGEYGKYHVYESVDPRTYRKTGDYPNTGDDLAALSVWCSPIYDLSESDSNKRGLFIDRGSRIVPDQSPTKVVTSTMFDYSREDSLVHYEDCRGLFSRGPRPAEQPKKVEPITPYYQNLYRYTDAMVDHSTVTRLKIFGTWTLPLGSRVNLQDMTPLYRVYVGGIEFTAPLQGYARSTGSGWFEMNFRSEYLWESSRFYPAYGFGRTWFAPYNAERAQVFEARSISAARYDGGAWTGWKDDSQPGTQYGSTLLFKRADYNDPDTYSGQDHFTGTMSNALASTYMPFAVGPRMSVTTDMIFHMLLVNERRGVAL